MSFQTKKIRKIQSLGERIKRTRRRKRLSLAKMESATKIRARYLRSIEKGQYQDLPGDIYVRGFLKKISQTLNMDYQNLISLYESEISNQKAKNKYFFNTKGISDSKFILTPKMIYAFFGFLVFVFIGAYFWFQVSGFTSAPSLTISKPQKTDFTTKSDKIVLEGKTDPGANLKINGQSIEIDLEGNFSQNIQLKQGLNKVIISADNKIGKETTLVYQILSKSGTANQNILGANTKKDLILILTIENDSTWVSVASDSKKIFEGLMLPESQKAFVAKKNFEFSCGDAGNVKLNLNGQDLGLAGQDGETINNKIFNLGSLP